MANATPMPNDHKVTNAWFGTTRSYTFMVKKILARPSTLISTAAMAALR